MKAWSQRVLRKKSERVESGYSKEKLVKKISSGTLTGLKRIKVRFIEINLVGRV